MNTILLCVIEEIIIPQRIKYRKKGIFLNMRTRDLIVRDIVIYTIVYYSVWDDYLVTVEILY